MIKTLILVLSNFLRLSQRNIVDRKAVFDFKESFCDENRTIAKILRGELQKYFISPILDVGAGTGDLAYNSLEGKDVILLDVIDDPDLDYPCRPNHKRICCDFFRYYPVQKINTVLISHTLQFIDDDLSMLNSKINEIAPEYLILVLNLNNDFMGELVNWSELQYEKPNPEVRITGFPNGYNLVESRPFTAKLKCHDFETLARQISYLMLIDLANKKEVLINFLMQHLEEPEFEFNQTIDIYKKS